MITESWIAKSSPSSIAAGRQCCWPRDSRPGRGFTVGSYGKRPPVGLGPTIVGGAASESNASESNSHFYPPAAATEAARRAALEANVRDMNAHELFHALLEEDEKTGRKRARPYVSRKQSAKELRLTLRLSRTRQLPPLARPWCRKDPP